MLVELHNRHVFEAGLIVVGTLAYMSWLNEYGAIATAARTQDIDLARGKTLKLAATLPFLSSMMATQLPFHQIPGARGRSLGCHVGGRALHLHQTAQCATHGLAQARAGCLVSVLY